MVGLHVRGIFNNLSVGACVCACVCASAAAAPMPGNVDTINLQKYVPRSSHFAKLFCGNASGLPIETLGRANTTAYCHVSQAPYYAKLCIGNVRGVQTETLGHRNKTAYSYDWLVPARRAHHAARCMRHRLENCTVCECVKMPTDRRVALHVMGCRYRAAHRLPVHGPRSSSV